MKAFTLCFTGISGSGKTTLAKRMATYFFGRSIPCQVLDGDEIREKLGHLFGYSREERMKNSRVVRMVSQYLNSNGIVTLLAIVAPYEEMRRGIRQFVGGDKYVEVFLQCSYETCARRDVKGYYQKQRLGEMQNLNGADAIYETPANSDIVVNTETETLEESVAHIIDYLEKNGYVV